MNRMISVIPAFGRDYTTAREALAAWKEGRDFLIQDMEYSGYINKYDDRPGVSIKIRYSRMMKIVVIP